MRNVSPELGIRTRDEYLEAVIDKGEDGKHGFTYHEEQRFDYDCAIH